MNITKALESLLLRGQKASRYSWEGSYIVAVYPLDHPTIIGDDHDYLVYSGVKRLSPTFTNEPEAMEWIEKKRDAVELARERYERYVELRRLRADTPLDFAAAPDLSPEEAEALAVVKIPRMSNKRVTAPFLAKLNSNNTLVPYSLSNDDLFAEDWKVS